MMTHAHGLADSGLEADVPGSLTAPEGESPGILQTNKQLQDPFSSTYSTMTFLTSP